MNRPSQNNQNFGKRPTDKSDQAPNPSKIQRNFHVNTEQIDEKIRKNMERN